MVDIDVEQEKKEILKRYRHLLKSCKHNLDKDDRRQIRQAFELALDAHKDMRRKSGEPYIYHPIAVALIASEEIGLGPTSIICALLHDVVEDTHIMLEDIRRQFGDKVARIIDGLTKISTVFDPATNSLQAENFRKMLLTLSDDVRVILIKLADRLHNMRTLDSMSRSKQLKIASETLYLYAPLAHRLGLYAIKTELEDLSIKYTETEKYREIVQKLKETRTQRSRYINKFIEPIENALKADGFEYEIKGRPKSIYSILNKMRKQEVSFDEVYDLFAIRIIVDTPIDREKSDCWKVYSIVTDFYHPNPDRLRDWISTPRTNGYESLHTTVMGPKGRWVEVQIRTRRMDEIAEKGYAAHWKYKDSKDDPQYVDNGLESWLTRVREILENPESNALDFLDDFKLNLFSEEIFVFTPKGELRKLPANATALDFAFDIHSDVGGKCIGAKINNRLVPISHKLSNGDQVEIITSSKQKPSEDWLGFAVTSKAKAKIKHLLNEEKRVLANDGKEILERKFRAAKVEFNHDNIQTLAARMHVVSALDLYYLIAKGKIDKETIDLSFFHSPKEMAPRHSNITSKQRQKPMDDKAVILEEEPDLVYNFAKCCNPIPGDDIFGFITIGEGVKIHRTNCPNAIRLNSNYGYRILKARWAFDGMRDKAFLAAVKVTGIDSVGIVSNIADIISRQLQVNMKSITIDSSGGTFEGTIYIYIYDTIHLEELMEKIRQSSPLIQVSRIDVN